MDRKLVTIVVFLAVLSCYMTVNADDKPASTITDTGSTRTTTNPVTESAACADAEISPTSTAADTSITATVLDTASIGPTTTIPMEATAMPVKKANVVAFVSISAMLFYGFVLLLMEEPKEEGSEVYTGHTYSNRNHTENTDMNDQESISTRPWYDNIV